MKKLLLILWIVLVLIGCTRFKPYVAPKENVIPKTRVIVGNFYNYSRFGTNESDLIAKNILIEKLKNNNHFTVIENSNGSEIVEKLAFLEPRDSAFSILKRRILDVDYVIVGSLITYNLNMVRQKNIVYDLDIEKSEVRLEFKIIDVNTGRVWSLVEDGTAFLTVNEGEKKLVDSNDFFFEKLEKISLEKTIENGVEKITKKIRKLPWTAFVLEKDGNKLRIDMHQKESLNKGTEFDVYEQGELIIYRDKVFGYEEKKVGTAKLVSYGEQGEAILKYKGVDFLLPAVVKLK